MLRAFQSWVHRSSDQVLALRLTESFGLDALDASEPGPSIADAGGPGSNGPDGRFFAWLAQLRYARQLPQTRGIQLVARADAQLSADPLLPLERFSVGGSDSVRGYPENQMVRDNALVASLELRVPVLRDPLERPVLELAPFFDFGKAWNRDGFESFRSIASIGLGIRWSPRPRIGMELYWGARLRDVDTRETESLQKLGISARIRVATF